MAQKDGGFLDRLVSQHLAPALRTWGFKIKARRANRAIGEFSYVLDIQAGRWNTESKGDFTINLGVFVPFAYSAVWEKSPPVWPQAAHCVIDRRIGEVMPGGVLAPELIRGRNRDHWWNYDSTTKSDRLAPQIIAVVTDYAIPFLGQFDSLRRIESFMAKSVSSPLALPVEYLYLAALKTRFGDDSAARNLLQLACKTAPAWADRARDTGLRLGLGPISVDSG
jgi:hypothetical protein